MLLWCSLPSPFTINLSFSEVSWNIEKLCRFYSAVVQNLVQWRGRMLNGSLRLQLGCHAFHQICGTESSAVAEKLHDTSCRLEMISCEKGTGEWQLLHLALRVSSCGKSDNNCWQNFWIIKYRGQKKKKIRNECTALYRHRLLLLSQTLTR